MTQTNPTSPQPWQIDFAESLAQLENSKDRATLAELRRGRGKAFGEAPRRDGWVLSQLSRLGRANFADDWEVNHVCLIASLFAEHSAPQGRGNLGTAFRRMLRSPGASEEAIERRFHTLLDSDSDDLPGRLRYAVSLLKSKEVPINWAQVLADVCHWDWPSRSVQKAWSREFWAPRKTDDVEHPGDSAAQSHSSKVTNSASK